jgi:hypothetical protein
MFLLAKMKQLQERSAPRKVVQFAGRALVISTRLTENGCLEQSGGRMPAVTAAIQDVTLIQALTMAIAFLGAVLGIINTWHGLDKSRVKLRVRPAHAIPVRGADPSIGLSIAVTNLSAFAITVNEVGVLFRDKSSRGVIRPILVAGGPLPRRLEPRSSLTLYARRLSRSDGKIRCAYASTACGVRQTGNSPALRQMARE